MVESTLRQSIGDRLPFYMDLVGHDVINNNQAVLGYLELVLASPGCDSALRGYAEKAFSHVRTSTMLVENIKRLLATMACDESSLGPLDLRGILERSEAELSKFFPDRRISVRLGEMPPELRVVGNSAARDMVMNAMVSVVRLDPGRDAELRVKAAESVFRGGKCWTVTIEAPRALLPPSLKDDGIKCVYLMDSSLAVKLSGLLFSGMIAEALGGDFDAYPLADKDGLVGTGMTITLRRAEGG